MPVLVKCFRPEGGTQDGVIYCSLHVILRGIVCVFNELWLVCFSSSLLHPQPLPPFLASPFPFFPPFLFHLPFPHSRQWWVAKKGLTGEREKEKMMLGPVVVWRSLEYGRLDSTFPCFVMYLHPLLWLIDLIICTVCVYTWMHSPQIFPLSSFSSTLLLSLSHSLPPSVNCTLHLPLQEKIHDIEKYEELMASNAQRKMRRQHLCIKRRD